MTSQDVELMRQALLDKLRAAPWKKQLPQTAHHLKQVIQKIFLKDSLNGCALHCPTQQSLGHASLVDGGNILKGHDLENCFSVKMLSALDEFFQQRSSLIVGSCVENTSCFEREICPTPNCGFERCRPYIEEEAQNIAEAINFYLLVCHEFADS